MKTPTSFVSVLGVALFLSAPQVHAGTAGQVQFAVGNVQITSANGAARPLKKGDAVNEGDSISTSASSSAQIKMQDGGFVAVRPETQMKVEQFVFTGKQDGTERGYFSLLKGGFRAVTGLVGRINKQNYKINTPAATIGIRGTDHETFVVPAGTPGAGAYSKVNVGETTLTTNLGTINVKPNQMGFAGGLDQSPKITPINTQIFTVSAAPSKTIKEAKEEKKEAEADKPTQQAAKQDAKEDKKEDKKEGDKQDQKVADKGGKGDKADTANNDKKGGDKAANAEAKADAKGADKPDAPQQAKQDNQGGDKKDSKQADSGSGGSSVAGKAAGAVASAGGAVAGAAGGAAAGGAAASGGADSGAGAGPTKVASASDSGGLRTDTKMDAAPVSSMAPPPAAEVAAPKVAAPLPPAPDKPVVTVKLTDTSGNKIDVTQQTVTNAAGGLASVGSVGQAVSSGKSFTAAIATVLKPAPISDTIANLLKNPLVVVNTDVTVTDAASLADLATIAAKNTGGALNYASVKDTVANLTANAAGYVAAGKNVMVTDVASVAQLSTIATKNTGGTLTVTAIGDTVANLSASAYVKPGVNVTVTDAASIAQLTGIKAANGTGTLTYTALADTAANLATNTGGYVAAGKAVTVTDAGTIAQLTSIKAANGAGALTYTALTDTAANLATNTGGYVAAGKAVTVTDAGTIAQLTGIKTTIGTGALSYTALTDTAANLATNTGGYVVAGKAVTVTDAASIAQLNSIKVANGTGTLTYASVTDTLANLTTNTGGYVATGKNVKVADVVTLAQLTTFATNNAGVALSATAISDTAAGLSASAYVKPGVNVNVTDAASIAQLTSIKAANGAGALTYTALSDTAANLATNTGGYVAAGKAVTVTDAGTIAQLTSIKAANGTGALSYTALTDTAANLAANTGGYVAAGKAVTVTDAGTIAQLTSIKAANGAGALTYTALTDTAANLASNTGGYVAAGKAVTVTDAASIAQLTGIKTTIATGVLNYGTGYGVVSDSIANLTANVGGYVAAGKNVSVTDVATTAQLTTLSAMNAGGIVSYSNPSTEVVAAVNLTDQLGVHGAPVFSGPAANVALTAANPNYTVGWVNNNNNCMAGNGWGCVGWVDTTTLTGATVPVNANATSFATTGIQFGRYTTVASHTQTATYPFDSSKTGVQQIAAGNPWAYGVVGYLDTPTTLSAFPAGIGQPPSGTFGYILDGVQPAPIDGAGNKGALTSLSLTANFATNTLSATVAATMGTTAWVGTTTALAFAGNFSWGVLSVTKGVGTPVTCLTCSGNISVGFTGQNYVGAVVAYALWDFPAAPGVATSVDGVAAMTRVGGSVGGLGNPTVTNNPATVAPTTFYLATAGGMVGSTLNTASTVTANASNVLTSYTIPFANLSQTVSQTGTVTCTTCSGSLSATTGVRYGFWDAGIVSSAITTQLANGQFSWITGPAVSYPYLLEATVGTANYALDGGTAPTNQNGVAGTLTSASLVVNFTKQVVGINLGLTLNGHTWLASTPAGSEAPLGTANTGQTRSTFFADSAVVGAGQLLVTMDGMASTSGNISGQLTGATINGALFNYHLKGTPVIAGPFTSTDSVVSQAASVTMTGPVATGGAITTAFTAGATGTLNVQAATTTNVTLSATGIPTALSTTGGVVMTVGTLTQQGITNTLSGLVTTAGLGSVLGERVDVTGYGTTVTNAAPGGLVYSNYGWWRKFPNVVGLSPAALTGTFTNGYFAGGMSLTPTASMPTVNNPITATYNGTMVGGAQDSANNTLYQLTGLASLTATFAPGGGTLNGSLYSITATNNTTAAVSNFNDLTINGTITSTTSSFAGAASAGPAPLVNPSPVALNPLVATGTASGHFYGPAANEATGVWSLTSGTVKASGAFGVANGTSAEQANGVVALAISTVNGVAATGVNTSVSYQPVMYSGINLAGLVEAGGYFNNTTRISKDAAGNVTGFDVNAPNSTVGVGLVNSTSTSIAIGTAVQTNTGADPATGISWGRWQGGNLSVTDRLTGVVTSLANTTSSMHWLAGPAMTGPVTIPISGTYVYTKVGGTNPTDNLGNVGTLNSANLMANFTAKTVNVGVNATVATVNYVATGTNLPIDGHVFGSGNTTGGSFTTTANTAAIRGGLGGGFTGIGATGAGMTYAFVNGATVVNGVVAFKR